MWLDKMLSASIPRKLHVSIGWWTFNRRPGDRYLFQQMLFLDGITICWKSHTGDMRCTRYQDTVGVNLSDYWPCWGNISFESIYHIENQPGVLRHEVLECESVLSITQCDQFLEQRLCLGSGCSFLFHPGYLLEHTQSVYSHIERHMGVHPHTSWQSMQYVGGWIPLGGIHHYTSDTPQSHHAANRRNRQSQSHA